MSVDCDICKTVNIHKNQFLHCKICQQDICKSCMYKQKSEKDEDWNEIDEEEQEKILNEERQKFKAQRAEGQKKKETGVFLGLLRSKGSMWLSNRPEHFFEWS